MNTAPTYNYVKPEKAEKEGEGERGGVFGCGSEGKDDWKMEL